MSIFTRRFADQAKTVIQRCEQQNCLTLFLDASPAMQNTTQFDCGFVVYILALQ